MKHVLAVSTLLALFLFFSLQLVSPEPYSYDEADYMYAASLGFWANYTDTPSLPLTDFLKAGLAQRNQSGQRQELSQLIRRSNDMVFYRHWHGPLYQYLLIPVSRLPLDERRVRSAMLAIPAASVITAYLGCLWLIPGTSGMLAGLLSGVLVLSSHAVVWPNELSPHQLFALCSLCFLCVLAKAVLSGREIHWYIASAIAGLAFCTMEIALVLMLTFVIAAWFERQRLAAGWTFAGKCGAIFAATVLLAWPAAVLKLSFVKAYLFMGYLAVFRATAWGRVGFLDTWRTRFLDSPLEWTLILLSAILFIRSCVRKREGWKTSFVYPLFLYSVLMIAATVRVWTRTPRYGLPFTPALDVFAGLTLAPSFLLRRPAGFAALALLIVGLCCVTEYKVSAQPRTLNPRPSAVLSYIYQNQLAHKSLLVPQDDLPMIHYYFPNARLRGYYDPSPDPSDRTSFAPDAILYPGFPLRFESTPAR